MRAWLGVLLLAASAWGDELPSATDLLQRSIEYHDPQGEMLAGAYRLSIEADFASGSKQLRVCEIDFRNYDFEMVQTLEDGTVLRRFARGEDCGAMINGDQPDEEQTKQHQLHCERSQMYRDYISYLWGLPMKLNDAGAQLASEVRRARFQEQDVFELVVQYDPEVGSEVWHIYLEPESARMVGYAFEKSDGSSEYIVLSDEIRCGSIRLPARRAWYHAEDDEYLGTDLLTEFTKLEAGEGTEGR